MDSNIVGKLDTVTFSILWLEGALHAPVAAPRDEPSACDTEASSNDASESNQD